MADATSPLVTVDYLDGRLETLEARLYGSLRAELYRALWIQGGVIIGAVVALEKLL